MAKVSQMTRSKPPSPAQFVAWYQESRRKALGVPSKDFVVKTLLAIYKAADDRKVGMVSQLDCVTYKIYREVDVAWLKDTNAEQRAYEAQIEIGYKDVVELIDKIGVDAVDEHGRRIFFPVPDLIEAENAKKAHIEAMKPRPPGWQQSREFRHGIEQLKLIKAKLAGAMSETIAPDDMDEIIKHAPGLTSTVKRVYKARRSEEIQRAMESK